jgi:hypothetical protein
LCWKKRSEAASTVKKRIVGKEHLELSKMTFRTHAAEDIHGHSEKIWGYNVTARMVASGGGGAPGRQSKPRRIWRLMDTRIKGDMDGIEVARKNPRRTTRYKTPTIYLSAAITANETGSAQEWRRPLRFIYRKTNPK